MNWAARRKLLYVMGVLLFITLVSVFIIHRATSVEPTCFDGKENGGEKGIDCGGACYQYCPAELADPKVRWQKAFVIKPGIAHAVAYIEHSYPTAAARELNYSLKLYDEKNTLITEKFGTTFLGPMGRTAIVETLIPVGNVIPTRVQFSVLPPLTWEKIPVDFSTVIIKTEKTLLEPLSGSTRLTATIENESRISFKDLDIVAILYGQDDNAITISTSKLKGLSGLDSATLYFTWPFEMPEKVTRIEIIPRFNPFNASSL